MPGRSRRMMPASLMAWAVRTSRCASPSSSMNSSLAPNSTADRLASMTRCAGEPCDAASPREQITKCAARPARVSFAMTPPHPNSMSSGCAPNASNGASLDFGVGFIGTFNGVAVDKRDLRRFFRTKIGRFPGAGNVMRAMHDRLHPAQPGVARRADLFLAKSRRRQCDVGIAAFVELERTVGEPRTDNFAFVWNIHEKFRHVARRAASGGIAGTHDPDTFEQTHT